ncbi:hypothetical protein P879_03316 [Paragonimus westermani]|uniref:Uncharacterized protein n=1 Tax=Paragonimus westermani TaxID=34504 RepID=A0A8T0DNR3_9TREM|nr:hypothetical protein P879_03316 [Paragonimus westermani]
MPHHNSDKQTGRFEKQLCVERPPGRMYLLPAANPDMDRQRSLSPERSPSSRSDREPEWRPSRRGPSANGPTQPETLNEFTDPSRQLAQEAANQELVDLLRSQIACLLEENEKILLTLDNYRERLTNLQRYVLAIVVYWRVVMARWCKYFTMLKPRLVASVAILCSHCTGTEQKESAPDPSAEHMALQTELGESRLREAELTIAFGELQERIASIDRMIETDPEMASFFNAVTISTTTLSRQKPAHRTTHSQTGSPVSRTNREASRTRQNGKTLAYSPTRRHTSYTPEDQLQNNTIMRRRSSIKGQRYGASGRTKDSGDTCTATDFDVSENSQCSGLESPQSDSGCSLNSHTTTSDAADHRNSFEEPYSRYGDRTERHSTFGDVDRLEQGFHEDANFRTSRPSGLVSLLRRSRSSAADHPFMSGFHSELHSPISPTIDTEGGSLHNRVTDGTPTPTDSAPTMFADRSNSTQSELKGSTGVNGNSAVTERFSKLRASFRQSFGFGPSKPDFRMEAFAARQGEARALLSLRETRMELLRVQSRCQTLQRHMERLEGINTSRMEELEASAMCERDLRQDIRGLQRRIFELEAEHREFKVNQRIKEMELMSKLAEVSLRLSHAELANQQANVWSELNKAHQAASDLFTPTQSQQAISAQNGQSSSVLFNDHGHHRRVAESAESEKNRSSTQLNNCSTVRTRPSLTRVEVNRQSYEKNDRVELNRNTSCNDLTNMQPLNAHETQSNHLSLADRQTGQRTMDQSLGSLSDLRLQPDQSPINISYTWR